MQGEVGPTDPALYAGAVLPPPGLRPVPRSVEDFDLSTLVARKKATGTTISVCLPARDEEATVGHIVATVRRTLMESTPLVDEVVVMDDGSIDATAAVAAWEGARVVSVDDVLPEERHGRGKGNAMWRSLHATTGDIVCWVDADIRNFGHHFVSGLLGPLLTDPDLAFTKGYYRRPLHGEPSGGGRVTELVARPLISVLFPDLAGFIQPLSGEYAGRRSLLEQVPFVEGWGVEFALLIDVVTRAGLDATAQVDLGVREHRNRPLDDLGPQSTAIVVTALRRAGLLDADHATLRRFTEAFELELVDVEARERPPIATVADYRTRFDLDPVG
jgi:glucosyl-3-phosphoglycerate synthase